MSVEKERVGLPIIVYPVIVAWIAGAISLVVFGDLSMMFAVLILFLIATIIFLLWTLIGNKVKRNGRITKQPERGDIFVSVHCTKYMVGGRPIVIEKEGVILAKLWHGNTISLPLNPGLAELSIYRNKNDKTKIDVEADEESEIFLWFDHGEIGPTRAAVFNKGDPLPETKSLESYISMRRILIALSIPTIIFSVVSIMWSLHHLGAI